jgi:hypothetical protein
VSSSTWTPPVPWSKFIPTASQRASFKPWRAVEGQHLVSTLRLVGNDPARQDVLERVLEASKPPVPPAAQGLHYLLSTPFRYPPSPSGSRFRAWADPGVLYAAIERRTACAESGYWRWRFLRDSAGLSEIPATAQTLFQLGVRGPGISLVDPPLRRWHRLWTHPVDYDQTQRVARQAREDGQHWIAYQSVRDPEGATCLAVLDPRAIRPAEPLTRETWYLAVTRTGVIWRRDRERFVFDFERDFLKPPPPANPS